MSLLAVGLSHRTAPTSLLERVAAGVGDSVKLLHVLADADHVEEVAVLSTCNRIEVYASVSAFHGGHLEVTDALARVAGVAVEELQEHLYVDYDVRAVQHLFTVACGLDSMLVGEAQIVGQVRSAFRLGETEGTVGRMLGEALRHALRTGKRARSETAIDRAGASLVGVAVEQATGVLGPLAGLPVAVVGAGATGALAATTLHRAGTGPLTVVNRTVARGQALAGRLGGGVAALETLPEVLAGVDLAVFATASVGLQAGVGAVAEALERRAGRPLVLVDLALPRDVDPAVRELPGVTLIDLDTLAAAVGAGAAGDVERVRAIVAEEVSGFVGWQRAVAVAPTVVALRAQGDELVRTELARLEGRLPDLDEHTRAEVADTVRRVVEKLIHAPTVRVKQLAGEDGGDLYADALRELFDLPRVLPAAVSAPSADGEIPPREPA